LNFILGKFYRTECYFAETQSCFYPIFFVTVQDKIPGYFSTRQHKAQLFFFRASTRI